MMKKVAILSLSLFLMSFVSLLNCNESDEKARDTATPSLVNETTITILPLGDSRVEGATINSVSYRYDLWKKMTTNQWNFDFIGTQYDNSNYPTLSGEAFDRDHEGIGGSRTEDILSNMEDLLDDIATPDVVLLGIGGNDLVANITVETAINNINQTIDLLQNNHANVTIFIEQIAPGRSNVMTPEAQIIFNAFNESISTLSSQQTNENSKVIVVDMSTNWTDDYMADNLHYNITGAKEVASRYYDALYAHFQ